MATNITNEQIDNATPNKGSSTPHPEQPNRKLTNRILKEIAAETNTLGTAATMTNASGGDTLGTAATMTNASGGDTLGTAATMTNASGGDTLGTAATRDVGTNAGNVMEVGAFGLGGAPIRTVGDLTTITKSGYYARAEAVSEDQNLAIFNTVMHPTNTAYSFSIGQRYYTDSKSFYVGTRWLANYAEYELYHTGNIRTTTGQSIEYPMTQKATTDAINGISDERDKTDVNEIGLGLEVIENINTFSFKLNNRDWYRQQAAKELIEVEEDGKVTIQEKINSDVLRAPLSNFEENDGSLKRDDVYTGFIAQDLKETLEELNLGHLGIVKNYAEEYEGGEDRFYIEHLALLPFLVNSVKQLSARVKELEDAAE